MQVKKIDITKLGLVGRAENKWEKVTLRELQGGRSMGKMLCRGCPSVGGIDYPDVQERGSGLYCLEGRIR